MSATFWIIEFSTYAYCAWCLYDSWKRGHQWLLTLIAAAVFGVGVELYFLTTEDGNQKGAYYTYGQFAVMLGWAQHKVPLWVGLGWGCILYASVWTAELLSEGGPVRPLAAGLLALNIDLSLDPIAEQLGFWQWHHVPEINYYNVPFDNFLGWMLIVGSYSWSSALLFRKVPLSWKWRGYWIPFAALVPALALTMLGQWLLNWIYGWAGNQALPFMVLTGASTIGAVYYGARARRNRAPNPVALAMPLYFHALLFVMLIVTGAYRSNATLIVVIPVCLFVGFTAFAWPSIDKLFPTNTTR